MDGLSLVIPALNEEQGLPRVLDMLKSLQASLSIPLEVIVVDDGSSDGTAQVAQGQAATVIRHPLRLGYGASLKDGIRKARYTWIGIIDADGSYDATELGRLLDCAGRYDMVIGARQGKLYQGGWVKSPMRKVFQWLCTYATGVRVPDINSGFRVFRKDLVLGQLGLLSQGFSFTTSLTMFYLLEGHVVGSVPVRYTDRLGRSKVRGLRDTLRTAQILVEMIFLYNPLKAFLILGLIPLALGVLTIRWQPAGGGIMLSMACLIWSLGGLGVALSRRNRLHT